MCISFLRGNNNTMKESYSFYDLWLSKIIPCYISLSRYTNIFLIDIIFPIEIINYILCFYLKIEQQFLDSRFRCKCLEKNCIIQWWKLERPIRFILCPNKDSTPDYSMHCSNKDCHIISNTFIRCSLCQVIICDECDNHYKNNLYYINNKALKHYVCICCQEERQISKKFDYTKIIKFDWKCNECFLVKREYLFSICNYCDRKVCDKCISICHICLSDYCTSCIKIFKKGKIYSNCSTVYCSMKKCTDCSFYCRRDECINPFDSTLCLFCHRKKYHQ